MEDEGGDEFGDFVLLATWEFGSGFKHLLQFSLGRLSFGFERSDTQEWIGWSVRVQALHAVGPNEVVR